MSPDWRQEYSSPGTPETVELSASWACDVSAFHRQFSNQGSIPFPPQRGHRPPDDVAQFVEELAGVVNRLPGVHELLAELGMERDLVALGDLEFDS